MEPIDRAAGHLSQSIAELGDRVHDIRHPGPGQGGIRRERDNVAVQRQVGLAEAAVGVFQAADHRTLKRGQQRLLVQKEGGESINDDEMGRLEGVSVCARRR